MRLVVQRVSSASVRVEGERVGAIGLGVVVLVGVGKDDTEAAARRLAAKVARLRIFPDETGKMNRALDEVGGAVLAVSQFTLYGDTRKGHRPSFVDAAPPEAAAPVIEAFLGELRSLGVKVATGRFQAHMEVALVNDGPVTILMEG
ncbi:MAG: D-aminoacyl-tRNA deacylase [Candidatus Methylomirabilales bacterium]